MLRRQMLLLSRAAARSAAPSAPHPTHTSPPPIRIPLPHHSFPPSIPAPPPTPPHYACWGFACTVAAPLHSAPPCEQHTETGGAARSSLRARSWGGAAHVQQGAAAILKRGAASMILKSGWRTRAARAGGAKERRPPPLAPLPLTPPPHLSELVLGGAALCVPGARPPLQQRDPPCQLRPQLRRVLVRAGGGGAQARGVLAARRLLHPCQLLSGAAHQRDLRGEGGGGRVCVSALQWGRTSVCPNTQTPCSHDHATPRAPHTPAHTHSPAGCARGPASTPRLRQTA